MPVSAIADAAVADHLSAGEFEVSQAGELELLAVGRLSKIHGRDEGELAAVAIDAAQHKGLGTELYTFKATDPDPGTIFLYDLVAGNDAGQDPPLIRFHNSIFLSHWL